MSFLQDELANLTQSDSNAYAMRYVTVISSVIMVYDAVLLLPQEIRFIWSGRWNAAKLVYLFNRYMSFLALGFLLHGTAMLHLGDITDAYCRGMMLYCFLLGAASIGVANYLVLLKVWYLWVQRPWAVLVTTVAWAMTYLTTLVVVCITISQTWSFIVSLEPFGVNVCIMGAKPRILQGVWAAPLVFEVLVFGFIAWDAANRPRPAELSLAGSLYRDGLVFFVALFILRLFNLITTTVWPTTLVFVGSALIWGVNLTILHRLILNQAVAHRRAQMFAPRPISFIPDDQYTHAMQELDELETPNTHGPRDGFSFFDNDVFGGNGPRPTIWGSLPQPPFLSQLDSLPVSRPPRRPRPTANASERFRWVPVLVRNDSDGTAPV